MAPPPANISINNITLPGAYVSVIENPTQQSAPFPPPPGTFFLATTLAGAHLQYPVFPTADQFTYWTARGVTYFRIPFNWSIPNPTYGTSGIQPTAFGALDDTSTNKYPLQGTNRIYNSDNPVSAPWQSFAAAGTITFTPNVGVGPNGYPSHLLVGVRPTNTDYQVYEYGAFNPGGGQWTWGAYFQANTPADVGKTFYINFYDNGAVSIQSITLTSSWQLVTTTYNVTEAVYVQITPFGGSGLPGSVGILISEMQVNAGATRVPYRPTVAGYVQATDELFDAGDATGSHIIFDCHMSLAGPGGLAVGFGIPVAALADMWSKIVARWGSRASFYAVEIMNEPPNGIDVALVISYSQLVINAVRALGFTGPIIIQGTNYSGVWNWASGQGQPFNNSGLNVLTDPLNKLIYMGHGYFDRDSSGSNFAYSIESTTPGTTPPPISTNPNIGTLRLSREFIPWLQQHGLQGGHGEFGASADYPYTGGDNNWAAWITMARNDIDLCKANNMPCMLWTDGPGFGFEYPFNLGPYSAVNGARDYSGAGVDSVLIAGIFNHYVTNTHPQPTAYLLVAPQTITSSGNPEAPNITTDVYGTVGTPTNPLTIIYGGIVPSGVVITPHAKYSDGTNAGGTFIPSSLSLTPGDNALATFTYTPANVATILISTTNNQGWTDPPAVVCSTQDDAWKDTGLIPSPIYDLTRSYTPHLGPVLNLLHPVTKAAMDWSFDLGNDFNRVAIQAWAGRQDLIPVAKRYDIGASHIDMPVYSGGAFLSLQNAQGYPEIVYTNFSGTANVNVTRTGAMTIIAKMKQTSGGNIPYISSFLFSAGAPYNFGNWPTGQGLLIENTGYIGNTQISINQVVGQVALGITNGVYHNYTGTYQQGATPGLVSYIDGTQHATSNLTATYTSQFTLSQIGNVATITNLVGIIHAGDVAVEITGSDVPANDAFVTDNGDGTWQMSQSATVPPVACRGQGIWYALNTGFDGVGAEFGFVSFGSAGWTGADQYTTFIPGHAVSSGQLTTILGYQTTHYATPLPDTLPPIFINVANQNVSSGVAGTPFSGITLQDAAGTTDSIVFTLTGHAATMAGTGLTGSGPYTLTADTVANINTKLQALTLTSTGSPGNVTHIAMVATSSTALTAPATFDATIFAAANPVISGMVGPNVSQDQGAPPLWQITVTDSNPSPTVSASIAVSGGAGTLSHIGPYAPSGTGPYTFGAMSQTELTRALRNLLWAPTTHTVGTTTTFTVTVTNNLGLTASASNTVTNIATGAMPSALTPVATPATLPRSFKGIGLYGGNFHPPLYVTDPSYYSWAAGEGLDTIRLAILSSYLVDAFPDETVQTRSILYQNLQSGDVSAIQTCVENTRQYGQYCILADINFGGILNPFPTGTSDDNEYLFWLDDVRVPQSSMTDFWMRMFTLFQNYPNIILSLGNEIAQNATQSRAMTTAVSAAIRPIGTFGATVPIYTPSVANVLSFDTTVWTGFTDPGPVYFDVHCYFDPGNSGTQNTCRTDHNPGFYFDTFVTWCRTNGYKAVVTEFAYGTDPSCTTNPPTPAINTVPSYFTTNNDVFIGWNWFWSGRIAPTSLFFLGPGGTNAQLPDLTSNLGNTF